MRDAVDLRKPHGEPGFRIGDGASLLDWQNSDADSTLGSMQGESHGLADVLVET